MKWWSVLLLIPLVALADESPLLERLQLVEERKAFAEHKSKYKWMAAGNFLYWKADIDGVPYATTSIGPKEKIKTRTPHFSYDPGFRLAVAFQSPYDFFDVSLVWTRFYTSGRDRAKGFRRITDEIGVIVPLQSIPNSARADCHFKGNVLDLLLARGVRLSPHTFLSPFFGMKALWSDIDWDISLRKKFFVPSPSNQDSLELHVKNDFRGIGGLLGMELDWKFAMGFGLNARAGGALLWGRSEEKTREEYTLLPANSGTKLKQHLKAKNSCHGVKGFMDIFTGIFWQGELSKARHVYIRIFAGYEFQQWPYIAQKTIDQETRLRERYSIGFQGFTGGMRIVF